MIRGKLCDAIQRRLVRYPPPYDAHYGVVPPPPPEEVPLGSNERIAVARALEALGRIDALTQALPQRYLVSRVLVRQEAVASSSIEGTQSTLDELLRHEEQGEQPAPSDDVRRVHRYALTLEEALGLLKDTGRNVFDVPFFQRLHRTLMTGDAGYKDPPGALRQQVVYIAPLGADIAYSTYNPAPPAAIAGCLEELAAYLRGGGMEQFTPVPVRLAVAHAHFEAVHPFRDGNGRLGRLLLPLQLMADGHTPLYLAPFIEANKEDYYAALKEAQKQLRFGPLINHLASAISGSVADVERTCEALAGLPAYWRGLGTLRADSAASRALPRLVDYPVLTAQRLAQLLQVSHEAANKAVRRLVELGVLRERTGYQRNRIYAAEDVLRVVNRPFGVAPILPDKDLRPAPGRGGGDPP